MMYLKLQESEIERTLTGKILLQELSTLENLIFHSFIFHSPD